MLTSENNCETQSTPPQTPPLPHQKLNDRIEDVIIGMGWVMFKVVAIVLKIIAVILMAIGGACGLLASTPALIGFVMMKLSSRSNLFSDNLIGDAEIENKEDEKKESVFSNVWHGISSKLEEGMGVKPPPSG